MQQQAGHQDAGVAGVHAGVAPRRRRALLLSQGRMQRRAAVDDARRRAAVETIGAASQPAVAVHCKHAD